MRVILRSRPGSADGDGLEFFGARRKGDWFFCTAAVTVGGDRQTVAIEVYGEHFLGDMLAFFEDMARYRRGWTGGMSWWTPESNELLVHVRNPEGTEATFDVSIARPPDYDIEWKRSLAIPTDELPPPAEAMRKLTGLSKGHRFQNYPGPDTWQPTWVKILGSSRFSSGR